MLPPILSELYEAQLLFQVGLRKSPANTNSCVDGDDIQFSPGSLDSAPELLHSHIPRDRPAPPEPLSCR